MTPLPGQFPVIDHNRLDRISSGIGGEILSRAIFCRFFGVDRNRRQQSCCGARARRKAADA